MFAQWTIDGVLHQFNKNWLARQNITFLRNTQTLLYQKNCKHTPSPVNLLYPPWYEIPCILKLFVLIVSPLTAAAVSSVSMAERSRAYVYDCCGATKTSRRSTPLATYVKERLSPSTKNTVTECYGLQSLSANSMFIVQHTDYR